RLQKRERSEFNLVDQVKRQPGGGRNQQRPHAPIGAAQPPGKNAEENRKQPHPDRKTDQPQTKQRRLAPSPTLAELIWPVAGAAAERRLLANQQAVTHQASDEKDEAKAPPEQRAR